MTSRYCYCPATAQRITMRLTIRDRIRRKILLKRKERDQPDVYMVTGFFPPVWIRH